MRTPSGSLVVTLLASVLTTAFLFSALSARAGDPPPRKDLFVGLTVTKTYPRVKVTHYSATPRGGRVCPYENGIGGADESASGFRPLQHTITKPGLIYGRPTTLTAVPQEGGTAGVFKCYFALPDVYPGKLFFAGDTYGEDSNGLLKTDVSSPCTEVVNVTKFSKMVVYDCGRQAARVGPLYQKVARGEENPLKPVDEDVTPSNRRPKPRQAEKPIDPRECPWYAVAECSKRKDDLLDSEARLGGEFSIIDTESVPSFARGWYCLVSSSKEKAGANEKLSVAKKRNKTAYVKKGC